MGKDVLYVGDHIFGDIIKSKKQKAWRTMLVVPELNHELKVFHDKRELFNTLETLDTSISELLRSFDMTSNQGPDAVNKIKHKIQVTINEIIYNSLFCSMYLLFSIEKKKKEYYHRRFYNI